MSTQPGILSELEALFQSHRIPFSQPGFYDHDSFMHVEQHNPAFLENYARYVRYRDYTDEYLEETRDVIRRTAERLSNELQRDGRLSSCIIMTRALARILEKQGIWCYSIGGSLVVDPPSESGLSSVHFYAFDVVQRGDPGFDAAHAWVVAPPYDIVDLTIKQQPYSDKALTRLLPDFILAEASATLSPQVGDYCSPPLLHISKRDPRFSNFVANAVSRVASLQNHFPSSTVVTDTGVRLKYVTCSIKAPPSDYDLSEEEINGRSLEAIYEELVAR